MTDTMPQIAPAPDSDESSPWSSRLPSKPVAGAVAAVLVLALAGGAYELTKPSSSPTSAITPAPAPVGAAAATTTASKTTAAKAAALASSAALTKTVRLAKSDAIAKGSVHIVTNAKSPKYGRAIVTGDSGTRKGTQSVSVRGGHVVERVTHGDVYFSGDEAGLTFLGMRDSSAATTDGRWYSLTPGQPGFATTVSGVMLASALTQIKFAGPLTSVHATRKDGQRVVGIRGREIGKGIPRNARATLWVTVGASPLPVELDEHDSVATGTTRFSKWGEHFRVKTPANLVGPDNLLEAQQ